MAFAEKLMNLSTVEPASAMESFTESLLLVKSSESVAFTHAQ